MNIPGFFKISCVAFSLLMLLACGGGGGDSAAPSPPPSISVSSTTVAFGDVVWDNFSDQIITVQSTGSSALTIGQIAQANPLAPPFSILNDDCSGHSLSSSQTCTLQVRFSPTTQGSGLTDSFDIPSNAPNPVTVNVSGSGRALRVFVNNVASTSCPEIELSITVTDKNGTPITTLPQGAFQLTENGISKDITDFDDGALVSPVSVAMALDYSNSMTNTDIQNLRDSSEQFINQLSDPADEAMIIKFAREVVVMTPFTTDNAVLVSAIYASSGVNGSETHLYDAIWDSIEATVSRANNRAVIVLTDGKDEDITTHNNGSVHTLSDVIARSIATGVPIFTIGLGDDVMTGVLNQLANETGGQYFYAPDSAQLTAVYGKIKSILSGKYLVKYNTASGSSKTMNIRVVNNAGEEGVVTRQINLCP